MNYVTLCSDASPGQQATGYAYYLRSDKGTVKKAWFKERREVTFLAEYNALLAGLEEAVNHIDGDTKLIIYCDNIVCLTDSKKYYDKRAMSLSCQTTRY